MSRWITRLTVDLLGRVHALDNNGVAWRLLENGQTATWKRLPALPTIDNPAARSAAAAAPVGPAPTCSSCGDRGGSFGLPCSACGRTIDNADPMNTIRGHIDPAATSLLADGE